VSPSFPREALAMSTKDSVIEMIRRMPDDTTVSDIMAELYLRQKIDEGLRQLDAGQGIEHEEVKKRLARWLA
jgi:predicted transcriptional regulator